MRVSEGSEGVARYSRGASRSFTGSQVSEGFHRRFNSFYGVPESFRWAAGRFQWRLCFNALEGVSKGFCYLRDLRELHEL